MLANILIQIRLAVGNICYDSDCIPQNYSKSLKPLPFVKVLMTFEEIQVLEVDDSKSIIEMQLNLQYEWYEPRIIIPPNVSTKWIRLEKIFKDLLWWPDFFLHEHQKLESKYLIGGGSTEALWLGTDDNILFLESVFKTFITCKMRFETYPFDSHKCYLRVSSWSYNDASLYIETKYVPKL